VTDFHTFTGKRLNLNSVRPDDIDIRDIAHHLAQINRFNGSAREPVSVAQHSVYVSYLVPDKDRLQGLLHDASEAYLGDVTKWLKDSPGMTWYRSVEEDLQSRILLKFGCAQTLSQEVMRADRLMCAYEARASGLNLPSYPGYELSFDDSSRISAFGWHPWNWQVAENQFLLRFRQLYVE
jgi:hypothetical protein